MDWLKQIIKDNPHFAISIPALLSSTTFLGNLFVALSDGQLDGNELHQLLSSASGFETIILIVIMFALRNKKQ